MAERGFYEVLGLRPGASSDEIQRSYRKLASTFHPDINKGPEAEKRFREISEAYDVLSDPELRKRYDEVGLDLDDLFGPRSRPSSAPVSGADQEFELELSVDDAYKGVHRWLTIAGPGGTRSVEVTIPPGATDGQRIRLTGQGGQGSGGAGDLYLVVRIAPHPRYRVEGRDIWVQLPLTPWEAALGARVAVNTPGGEAKVQVPPGSSSGRPLRLRGRGMPGTAGRRGDLCAEVRIMVPSRLTDEERRLFEQLAATSTSQIGSSTDFVPPSYVRRRSVSAGTSSRWMVTMRRSE
ncbi:DnaJ C-terminal domain-containing protein [Kribbella sp. NPDC004536]|uniref:DnaJ C-terminal domain-containing protein n=1 Tax=Kribbella sp. NPDC004536 TaxID=3364106 RepID=UPI003694F268